MRELASSVAGVVDGLQTKSCAAQSTQARRLESVSSALCQDFHLNSRVFTPDTRRRRGHDITPPLVPSPCFGAGEPASLLRRASASLPRGRPSRYFLGALVHVRASTALSGAAKGRRRSSQFVRASGKTLASTLRLAAASIGFCPRSDLALEPERSAKDSGRIHLSTNRSKRRRTRRSDACAIRLHWQAKHAARRRRRRDTQ